MNRKTKAILLGAALLTATGTAIAFGGPGNCDQQGGQMGMMQGKGPSGQMRGINQLDNLTNEQRKQLDNLHQTQQEMMRGQHNVMKTQVDAILTEEQREQLAGMQASRFGNHQMGGRHNW